MSPTNGESGGEPAPKKPRLSTSPEHNVSSTSKEFNDILARKKSLRKEIRAAIKKDLNPDSIKAQSEKVWKKVFELPVYQSARSIGLFLSMPTGEINTDAILKDAMKKGKEVYVPQVGKNFEKCDMELLKVILDSERSGNEIAGEKIFHEKWPKNKWKIPEPPEDMPIITAEPGDIDLLIVPGLGFDRTRSRIGQGKGYYDRFIARMITQETPISLVAVGLTPQLVEISIPVADYDRKMDMVVLPDEVIGA
jgi:5-formyltetrahydrofolate cyclo-ligase